MAYVVKCPVTGNVWCSRCYETLRARCAHRGHCGYRKSTTRRRERAMPPRRRPDLVAVPSGGDGGVFAGALAARWPFLAEFLACDVYDDGNSREPGSLLVCFGEGRWRAWINDRAASSSAWVSGATLDALLDSVEDGLQTDSLEWRKARNKGSRK